MAEKLKLNSVGETNVVLSDFKGIDKRKGADESSLFETKNISSITLPYLKTRDVRNLVFNAPVNEKITGIFSFDKAYVTTNYYGKTRIYSGSDFSSLSLCYEAPDGEIASSLVCRFDRQFCLFNINTGAHALSLMVTPDGNMNYPMRYEVPDLTDVIVYADRVIGCRRNQLRACKPNDITNWIVNDADGKQRAFLKNFQVKSNFTACTTFRNRAVFFTKDEMFELYGTNADTFDLVKIADVGCVNRNAVCEVDGVLYFVSKEGVMRYNSAVPTVISDSLCDRLRHGSDMAALGSGDHTLYVKLSDVGGTRFYTYNTITNLWAKEDDMNVICIVKHDGYSFAATENAIYALGDYDNSIISNDKDSFEWEIVTQDIHSFCAEKKRSSKLGLRILTENQSRTEVYVSYDGGEFEFVSTVISQGAKTVCIPLDNREYDSIRLMLVGKGEASIDFISRSFSYGGRAR